MLSVSFVLHTQRKQASPLSSGIISLQSEGISAKKQEKN